MRVVGGGCRLRVRALTRRLGWGHRGYRARPRRALLVLLAVLLLPAIGDIVAFRARMLRHNPDLRGWLENARAIRTAAPEAFYRENPFYIYPPFFLTLIDPLTRVPPATAGVLFELAKWVAVVVSLRAAWRLAAPAGEDVPPIVALGSAVFTWRFLQNDMGNGNINAFVLAAVLGSLWLVRRGRPIAAGALLALSISIKVAPALLLAYFAYKGWWRTLAGAAAGLLIFLVVWPALWFGWDANRQLVRGWYESVASSYVERGHVRSESANQSLAALINRLLGPHPALLHPDVHLARLVLPDKARNVLRLGSAAVVLAGLGWICRRRFNPRRSPILAVEAGLVLIATLLLSGITWKGHFVVLLLPYACLLAYLADARHSRRRRGAIAGLTAISFVLGTLTGDLLTPLGADYAEAFGAIAWGGVAAGAALVLVHACWPDRAALGGAPVPAPAHAAAESAS